LWVFYVLVFDTALPVQTWANDKRGEPYNDPEFLFRDELKISITMTLLIGGLVISLFMPIELGSTFVLGIFFYLIGLIIVVATLNSFAQNRGLVTTGIQEIQAMLAGHWSYLG
jgi:hypothetical protein